MVPSFRAGLVAAALALTASCDGNPAQPGSSSGTEQLTLRLSTAHFRVLADRASAAVLQAIADALEAAYPRVTADLRTGELATVSAHVWTDESSFNAAMRSNLGQVWQGTKGYVLGEFIVTTWGVDGLVRLVQTNGNVPATLGLSVADFEAQWYAFLKAGYGVPSTDTTGAGDEAG